MSWASTYTTTFWAVHYTREYLRSGDAARYNDLRDYARRRPEVVARAIRTALQSTLTEQQRADLIALLLEAAA